MQKRRLVKIAKSTPNAHRGSPAFNTYSPIIGRIWPSILAFVLLPDRETRDIAFLAPPLDIPHMRFRALDGFRGLCAVLVVLYHLPLYSHFTVPQFFLPNGQMLLDFFFVMSGFVIAGAYARVLRSRTDFVDFAISRFARLWPLHAAVLAIFVVIEIAKLLIAPHAGFNPPFTGRFSPAGIATSILLIHSLDLHSVLVWNGPSWTVSVEFWTYLIYGGLTIAAPRRPMLGAIGMALVGACGVAWVSNGLTANFDYGLFRCLYGFFCGVVTWRLWSVTPPTLAKAPIWLATAIEIVVTVGVFVYIAQFGGWPTGLAGPLVFMVFIAIYATERGWVTSFCRLRAFVRLGEISYSLYLIHYLIIVVFGLTLKSVERLAHIDFAAYGVQGLDDFGLLRFHSEWFMDGVSAVFIALVIAGSELTNRWIEEPGRKYFRRFAKKGGVQRAPKAHAAAQITPPELSAQSAS